MKRQSLTLGLAGLMLGLSSPAFADNIADCEIVILQTVEDESGRGGAQVASYGPADEFLASVYDKDVEIMHEIGGLPIQAVMCKRIDIVPTKNDFKILATGIPLFLSQSFDSQNSDLISLFYKEGAFRKTYSGPGLTEETQGLLETRLDAFNEMEHGLAEKEAQAKAKMDAEAAAEAEEKIASETEEDPEIEQTVSLDIETDMEAKPKSETGVDLEALASEELVETLDAELETSEPVSPVIEVQEESELEIKAVEDTSEITAISSTKEVMTTLEEPLESE